MHRTVARAVAGSVARNLIRTTRPQMSASQLMVVSLMRTNAQRRSYHEKDKSDPVAVSAA
jgi:hypothetical protein